MSYSFDNKKTDRWSELADQYQSQLDELASLSDEDFDDVEIDDFDELEIL